MKFIAALKQHKFYIAFSAIAFIIGLTLGLLVSPDEAKALTKSLSETLEPIAEYIRRNPLLGVLVILLKNWATALLTFILGPFSPLIVAYNGWVIGVLGVHFKAQGKLLIYILGIVPHGIVEIPALIVAGGAGLRFGRLLVVKLIARIKGSDYNVKAHIKPSLTLIVLSLILFIIAAFIESLITPLIVGIVGGFLP